jgi:Zn-dependent peptidase ImmA (M78 family)/DNA-binding XRE family transcriptional regulator
MVEKSVLGENIKKAREQMRLTQAQLAQITGLSSPQIVSDIERGIRDVKAHELAVFATSLSIGIGELIQGSVRKKDSPLVCWRQEPGECKTIIEAKLISKVKQYSMLQELGELKPDKDLREETVDINAGFDEINTLGVNIKNALGLSDTPASGLIDILEERYGVQVWKLPSKELGQGSAASIKHSFGTAIFINSNEPVQRQNFSCAHELFHLITWNSFKDTCIQGNGVYGERVEKLANSFAASLMLPENYFKNELEKINHNNKLRAIDLFDLARKFRVVPETVLWRMQNLGIIANAKEIIDSPQFSELRNNNYQPEYCSNQGLPERFVRLAFQSYTKSQISRGKLAELLDTSLPDISEILESYGIDEEADYQREICTL